MKEDDADPHGGYTCAEVEEFCDDAQGDLNMISEMLSRRGHKVDCREHDVVHWVREALDRPNLGRLAQWWWRRKVRDSRRWVRDFIKGLA